MICQSTVKSINTVIMETENAPKAKNNKMNVGKENSKTKKITPIKNQIKYSLIIKIPKDLFNKIIYKKINNKRYPHFGILNYSSASKFE